MTRAPRVVLDTNIVLSALLFGGGAVGALRRAWQEEKFLPLISKTTAQELVRVLAYPKFHLTQEERQELLADYLPHATVVRVSVPPPAVPSCRDAFDLPFLQLALAGKAAALVSGDKDLLALSGEFAIPIITPAAFLDRFRTP